MTDGAYGNGSEVAAENDILEADIDYQLDVTTISIQFVGFAVSNHIIKQQDLSWEKIDV